MTIYGEPVEPTGDADGNLDLTMQNIRYIINIPEPDELSNNSIIMAINRANVKIGNLAVAYSVTGELVSVAKLNYAAYLAYQTYADRIFNVITGRTDRDGSWTPIAQEIVRTTQAKLEALKKEADDSIADLMAVGSDGTIGASMVIPTISKTKDALYYPSAYFTSDVDLPSWDDPNNEE